ncbi:MAG: hypothetical protein V4636_05390 [Pseudomonadota bacterium]
MKIWTNTEFDGHRRPILTAAVCVAENAVAAAAMLNDDLESRGLPRSATPGQFQPMAMDITQCRILLDGDY